MTAVVLSPPPARWRRHDHGRHLGLQGRQLPRRRWPLLGVPAVRARAPPPGVRRLLARAAAPCPRSRAADLPDLDLPGADAAVRVRGPDAPLHAGRGAAAPP